MVSILSWFVSSSISLKVTSPVLAVLGGGGVIGVDVTMCDIPAGGVAGMYWGGGAPPCCRGAPSGMAIGTN